MAGKVRGTNIEGATAAVLLDKELKMKPGVAQRAARAIRLKNELNLILELVVNMRGRLERELEGAVSPNMIDKAFIGKLKDLSQCYATLTKSRIDLDKSERAMEAEMTPAQEKEAVREFVRSLEASEQANMIRDLWAWYVKHHGAAGTSADVMPNTYDR